MRSWSIPTAAGIAGIAVGVLISRGVVDHGRPSVSVREPVAATLPVSQPAAAQFTLEDVRRVVREELDAREMLAARHGDGTRQPAVAPDPAQVSAAARASATLEAAIARRSWSDEDAQALRADFASMGAGQQAEWLRQYSVAVNQGRLVPESERAPF